MSVARIPAARLAPFFVMTAALHGAAVLTRFDAIAAELPPAAHGAILAATIPLLLVEGFFEGRLDYGETLDSLPLWMRITSRPVKASFTFAFVYLATVCFQTWNLSVGPLDPTPPAAWPAPQRFQFFAMFTFGMFFVNYLAATSVLIPLLRRVTAPLRPLPAPAALALLAAIGVALGYVAILAVASPAAGELAAMWIAITTRPSVALSLAFGGTWIPILVGLALDRRAGDRA